MKKMSSLFYIVALFSLILNPTLAFAAPLAGADADLTAYFYQFGGPTNDLTDANDSDSAGDVSWPSGNQDSKAAYIGHTSQFGTVVVDVSGATTDTGQNLNMQYWNGISWTALTLSAETHPFDTTGVNSFSFTPPEDWALTTISGNEAYYIRTRSFDGNTTNERGFVNAQISQISVLLAGGGGGGEESVPEFSDVLYVAVLLVGGWYVYAKMQQEKQNGVTG